MPRFPEDYQRTTRGLPKDCQRTSRGLPQGYQRTARGVQHKGSASWLRLQSLPAPSLAVFTRFCFYSSLSLSLFSSDRCCGSLRARSRGWPGFLLALSLQLHYRFSTSLKLSICLYIIVLSHPHPLIAKLGSSIHCLCNCTIVFTCSQTEDLSLPYCFFTPSFTHCKAS